MTTNTSYTKTVGFNRFVFSCFVVLGRQFSFLMHRAKSIPVSLQTAYGFSVTAPNSTAAVSRLDKGPKMSRNGENTNLTALTWAHAVNSQQRLTEALNSDIDMIEADIVLGKLNNTGPNIPVMAHPPANTSDLTLTEFLHRIMAHNRAQLQLQALKGVKLDFKSIEVFEGSLDTLKELIPNMTYPVWLNADIVSGPVNENKMVPVDPERFLAGCSLFEKAVLSVGWTTRWDADCHEGAYSSEEIAAMLSAIKYNNVTGSGKSITFPVRAGIAANSRQQLHDLVRAVNNTNESTLTVWSSPNDYVDVEKLRQLIFSFGFDRVYLDVPAELSSRLDLGRTNGDGDGDGDDGGGGDGDINITGGGSGGSGSDGSNGGVVSSGGLSPLLNFSLISAGMILASLWLQRTHF